MTIFVVMEPLPQTALEARIRELYPNDHLRVTETQWLISTHGSALDVVTKLGIYDPQNPLLLATGNAIVFATTSYHGRGPTTTWDWIKSKLEGANGNL